MSREVHVRFWERLGVKFPRATRHNRKSVMATAMSAFGGKAEVDFGWLEVCL